MKETERGFTMIEVMIALTLTAIAIMGIVALYMSETKASGYSRHTTEAAVLAQDKLENLRTQGAAVTILPAVIEANITPTGVAGGIFTRAYSEVLQANYADLTVTVTWSDEGFSHNVTMHGRRNL